MNNGHFGKVKEGWETTSWWTHTPLKYFDPILSLANEDIKQNNWRDVLWQLMSTERVCKLVYKTKEGTIRSVRIWQSDICAHVAEEIGLGWGFPKDEEEDVVKKLEDAIIEENPELPKISGQEPTFELTQGLQGKLRKIFDNVLEKANAIQQGSNGAPASIGRINNIDMRSVLTERYGIYGTLPWYVTHFKEHEEVLQCIQKALGTPAERRATVNSHGFLFFDDAGEDAAKTLAWTIQGLVSVVLEHERAMLKKCLCPRQEYFLHETKKLKKYFSDRCRFDHHNKVLRHEKSTSSG